MKKTVCILLLLVCCFSVFSLSMSDFKLSSSPATRKNPLKAKDGYVLVETDSSTIKMAFSGCLRGKEANKIVEAGNMFNSSPHSGKEYALVYFYLENVKDKSGKDKSVDISSSSFEVANEKYRKESNFSFNSLESGELKTTLYEGCDDEGFVLCEVNVGMPFYLVYSPYLFSDRDYWFSIDAKSAKFEDL